MANIAHASLTGSELHEPKGADSASLGTVYVSNGAGSGSWQSVGTSAFTGMIADFAAPVPPAGWLELDGSVLSTSTYSGLFAVMSMTSSGTRTNGSAVVTSIPSTSNFRVGYYIFGTGIAAGTTILSIDSASQVTLSATAGSSGTSSFFVSPFAMNTGTFTLPNLTTNGQFRRSRTSSTKVGEFQLPKNLQHTHSVSGTTGNQSSDHSHTYSGTTATENAAHQHSYTSFSSAAGPGGVGGGGAFGIAGTNLTLSENANHAHTYSGTTSGVSSNHTHTFSATSGIGSNDDATESRPFSFVVMTCIKT